MSKLKIQINYGLLVRFVLGFFILSLFFLICQNSVLAVWHGMDRTVSLENISNNGSDSRLPDMQLDNQSNPYIVWSDETTGNGDIYFKKWDPLTNSWTKMDGTAGIDNLSNNSSVSSEAKILLDSANNPYVFWTENISSNYEIFFSKWTVGTGWTHMDGITLGSENLSNNPGRSGYFSIQLDSLNNPYVAWEDRTTWDIYFRKWNPAANAWTKMDGTAGFDNISNTGLGSMPIMKIDSNDNPYVVWEDQIITYGNPDVYISKWTPIAGAWTQMDGVTTGYENISNNSGESLDPYIQLDKFNNPYIFWDDRTPGQQEIFFTKWTTGVGWTEMDGTAGYTNLSNNAGNSVWPQIVFSKANNPIAVWVDETTGARDIYFSKWTPGVGDWTQMDGVTLGYENLSDNSGLSQFFQIKLDSQDNPYIAWYDDTDTSLIIYDVFFIKWTPGTGWTQMDGITPGYENLSATASDTRDFQMRLNNINFPYFVWNDEAPGNFDIYFTKWMLELGSQITITASVDPSLSLTLSSTTCNLGTFDATKANTCQYNTTVTTNASSGYTAYIRDDGNLRNATNDINDVAGGTTTVGSEEYGVATSDADAVDITAKESSADCTTANGGASDVNALALTTSDQSYASEAAPIASNVVTLCHSASIAGSTPAGAYAQTVTITVVGNF